jgi:hypothetical protein
VIALLRALPLRLMGVLFAVHLVVMGIGAALYEDRRIHTRFFALDSEGAVWFVVFSATLLLAGAVVAVIAGTRPAIVFGGFLAFMAVDEVLTLHERLEEALHVGWVVLYLPVMALAGLAALSLLQRHRDVPWFAPAMLAGGACWAVSQVLEHLEWTGAGTTRAAHYTAMMIPEELLEATGSYLFAVALALVVRAATAQGPTRASSARRRTSSTTSSGVIAEVSSHSPTRGMSSTARTLSSTVNASE